MNKKIISISIILFILLSILIITYKNNKDFPKEACINNRCFSLEVASTTSEREKGLMFRDNLLLNRGMLFVFEKSGKYSFWMKNTLISLDIIWISKDNEIVHIESSVLPCKTDFCPSYSPSSSAFYVLEINSGLSSKYNLKEGDKINFIY